ncbi:MAG: hypothetical protein NVS1B11_00040 [Terriglobales bacterium]
MAAVQFDLIAIGTGAAATAAAYKCRKAGWQVAVVDSRPFGGTCQLRGCDPKKVLVGAGALIDAMQRMSGKGVKGDGAHIEWAELMRFKRTFTDPAPLHTEASGVYLRRSVGNRQDLAVCALCNPVFPAGGGFYAAALL